MSKPATLVTLMSGGAGTLYLNGEEVGQIREWSIMVEQEIPDEQEEVKLIDLEPEQWNHVGITISDKGAVSAPEYIV